MNTREWIDERVADLLPRLQKCWQCALSVNTEQGINLAGRQAVHDVLNDLVSILFPGCHGLAAANEEEFRKGFRERLQRAGRRLEDQIGRAFSYQGRVEERRDPRSADDARQQASDTVAAYIESLPALQELLQTDIVAAYEGDPAARSTMEVVMSYPGLYAVIVHRLAHELYARGVPLIPRIMSEHAHSVSGIDIHPGAMIGKGFFIDHGTGVVIGETCRIGDHVKLYQGVTLGALSFEKDDQGRLVKGIKRHPDVGDRVIIYAGATILGGNTTIGARSIIGGNVWLTHSVPPGSKVYNQQPHPLVKQADGRWTVSNRPWNDLGANI